VSSDPRKAPATGEAEQVETSSMLPSRPRLADHALMRRHLIEGVEEVVVHDARTGSLHRMTEEQWLVISGADGTRDFDGVCLAASRAGVYRRASEVRRLLDELHAAGLLADGLAPDPLPEPTWANLPLDPLPGFHLSCDGSGGCCKTYATIVFSAEEAARARGIVPRPTGSAVDDRLFSPLQGDPGRSPDAFAVTLVDGACAYLASDGHCRLHAVAGAEAKPWPCRAYPATFVEDGETVRVSVSIECACILASIGGTEGEPLVPPSARTIADLAGVPRVARLPERLLVHGGSQVSRSAIISWSRELCAELGEAADGVAVCWSLASALERDGLGISTSRAALASAEAPGAAELLPWAAGAAASMADCARSTAAWRSPRDRSRVSAALLAETCSRLSASTEPIERALAAADLHAVSEAFYLRAALHGHRLVDPSGELSVAAALRDRAVRMLVARALADHDEADAITRRHPLARVEATMRAHGVRLRPA
jgi:lysine-N-methylase